MLLLLRLAAILYSILSAGVALWAWGSYLANRVRSLHAHTYRQSKFVFFADGVARGAG